LSLGRSWGDTDAGRKRLRNEDAFVCEPPLFAVADGMGGAQAGELASSLAAAALREQGSGAASEERIAELLREANRRVYERATEDAATTGMGTTVTVALVEGDRVMFGHVGDSRAYLLRNGSLDQITDDHSLVAELVRSGRLSPKEAESHPQRSVITRALGTDPDVEIDTFSITARPGDLFLLCSDGLTAMVDDREILELAEKNRDDLRAAVHALLGAANRGGGEDNITVILFEIVADGGDTATMSAVEEPDVEAVLAEEDADTLSELDAVPVITDATEPSADGGAPLEAQPEAEGAEPEEPTAGFFHRLLAILVMLALLVLIFELVVRGLAR
jgi:protein phosphatase